jgi:hypothetical protein
VLLGAAAGVAVAVFALIVGALRIIFALLGGAHVSFDELGFIVYYVLAFIAGGVLGGLLWPMRRWIGGAYGIGVAAMLVVVGVIMLAVTGPVATWDSWTWIAWFGLSVVFGLAGGHGARDP